MHPELPGRLPRALRILINRLQKYALAILEADIAARKEKDFAPQGKTAPVRWIGPSSCAYSQT